jgi:hypothetical protein
MSYTSTQRFVKLTEYLLLEYDYTTAPNPEQYFVNTGTPAVGFEKIVNGYFNSEVQILNNPASQSTTNNVRELSVVQTGKNKFVTLDNDYLVPYLDTDPKLTSVPNLPVVFPSNIGVYYDTIKFHIVAGYNFNNLDGIILQVRFQERTGKKATILQLLVERGDIDLPILNPNPIYLGGALYDHYVEVKIPAYANMVYEFEILNGTPAQANTLAAKISSDGKGFLKDAPIQFTLYEITSTTLQNGYQTYIGQNRAELAVVPKDNYSGLAATIQENSFYNYLEYYPTWDGNFIEDFIVSEGSAGILYYVVNEIEVKEQVGLAYITTYNFSNTQTQDFNAPAIFRPVIINPLATSFVVNYTMRLVNRNNQNQIIRRATFNSFDVNKYGRDVSKITLTTGAYSQKVYNKLVQAPNVLAPYGVQPSPGIVEKKIPVFYKDNQIAITQQSVIIDKDGNLVSEVSSPNSTQIFGQGKATILVDPFDNFYKFTVYNLKGGTTPEILDLGTSLSYFIVFLDSTGQSVRVENIKNKTSVSNPTLGQVAFKVVQSNSKKILGFTTREFYVISKTPDGTETKLYSGFWQTPQEFAAVQAAAATGATAAATGATGTTTVTQTSATGTTGATGTSTTTTGNQIINRVPISSRDRFSGKPYVTGSSAILSVRPTNFLNTTGGTGPQSINIRGTRGGSNQTSNQSVSINISALANAISGQEAQNQTVQQIVNYYFTPGAPGSNLFKGIKPSQFLTAALQIHPKLENGQFDPKYIQYCNALNFPVTSDPGAQANPLGTVGLTGPPRGR